MAKRKKLYCYSTVKSFLEGLAGKKAPQLLQIYEKTNSPIKDEEMANKMKLKVTDIRTMLNRLHYRGITNYQKKRNKKTGWYSYTWHIDRKRILELIIEKQMEEIEKLEQKKETEESYSFFSCKNNCHEFPFEIAAEYQFKCPQCGKELQYIDNKKRTREAQKKIKIMKKEVEEFKQILSETQ